jgi:hypothetical protein
MSLVVAATNDLSVVFDLKLRLYLGRKLQFFLFQNLLRPRG